MRKSIMLSLSGALMLAALLAVPVTAQSDNSRNVIGDIVGPDHVLFTSASDVFTFDVSIPEGNDGDGRNGRLTVETRDYLGCVDYWGARIIKWDGKVMAEAVGDGSGSEFTGAAKVKSLPQKSVTVEIYYDHGCDTFPASMYTQYTFTGENIVVTPVP